MAEQLHAGERVYAWSAAAASIRAAILDQGWSEQIGAFTQAFGWRPAEVTGRNIFKLAP